MAGSTATLSVDLANSLLTTVTWTANYATTANTFGTIGTPTKTQIATGTFTVTSTVTNFSAQISIPAAATTGVEILFTVGAQTSGTFTVGKVQLEKSSTATSFDYRPYGTELQLAQRYYEVGGYNGTGIWSGNATNTGAYYYQNQYIVTKRTSPTTTLTTFGQSGFAAAASTIVYNSVGSFLATRTASSTINGGYFTDTWVASAEL